MVDAPPIPRSRRGRVLIFTAVLVVILGGLSPLLMLGRIPSLKVPDPNGYDDIVRASSMINGPWPGKGDLAKAEIGEVRRFLDVNKPALDLARVGIGRECLLVFASGEGDRQAHFDKVTKIRGISRLFLGESRVFEADGKFVDAARSCLDTLKLGQAMTQGGAGNDCAIGWTVQYLAMVRLRQIRDRLPVPTCRDLIRDVEALDRRRVSLADVEAGWTRFYRSQYNAFQQAGLRAIGAEKKGLTSEMMVARQSRDRNEKSMRFLLVGLATHAYHLDKGKWPRSLGELVPEYLPSVPTNSTTGQPIDYPTNPSGDLTDEPIIPK